MFEVQGVVQGDDRVGKVELVEFHGNEQQYARQFHEGPQIPDLLGMDSFACGLSAGRVAMGM
jgi:hypothetical protein